MKDKVFVGYVIILVTYFSLMIGLIVWLSLAVTGCGKITETEDLIEQIDEIDSIDGGASHSAPTPSLFIPDNCDNPPATITSTSGFKCKGSDTRGGSIVCLLPHQFTWKPYFVDNKSHFYSQEYFDEVYLLRRNGNKIYLKWAGYHNPVYLQQGKITRQHWRKESLQWDNVKDRVTRIVMIKNGKETCLRF